MEHPTSDRPWVGRFTPYNEEAVGRSIIVSMESKELLDRLFGGDDLRSTARIIAEELANRDLFPLMDLPRFLNSKSEQALAQQCASFYEEVRDIILTKNNLDKLLATDKRTVELNMAIWMSHPEDNFDVDSLAMYLCIYLIAQERVSLDEHVESLADTSLVSELELKTDGERLVSLTNPRLELKRRAIIVDGSTAIFPHEFMRRYYTSNFVDLPAMLAKAQEIGLDVSIRVDPKRMTEAANYTKEGLFEADHWYGEKFSKELLQNTRASEVTRHKSYGIVNMVYDARYTVFRTKMMDAGLREFSIEEYCPLELPDGTQSPAWGDKYYIQKFGHLVYDQKSGGFEHVDGAIRVFIVDEYDEHYATVQSGKPLDDHLGKRHKMFLVRRKPGEPGFDINVAKDLLTEWFRYNPHIQEYFSNTKAETLMTYEELDVIKYKRRKNP